VIDPVAGVFDPRSFQEVRCVVRFGEARSHPSDGRLAGKFLDRLYCALNHRGLVFFVVDRTLFKTVTHEFPAGVFAGLRYAGIVDAHATVDRQARPDSKLLVKRMEAPESDA